MSPQTYRNGEWVDVSVPADPPSQLTERGSIEDDIRVLDKALDEAIAQAVNLGALVRTDPRIKGTPMALEVKLRDLRASLRAALASPAPAGLDVERLAEALDVIGARYDPGGMELTSIVAEAYARAATRPAEDAGERP